MIFAAGTGNPFFTTDTAAALRALEIHAEAILMAKNGVEGVYDADPREDPDAEFIAEITHREAIERGLQVMDSTALSLCMDNDLPIYVFNMDDERNIERIVCGERVGTAGERAAMSDDVLIEDFLDDAQGAHAASRSSATQDEFATVRTGRASPAPARPDRRSTTTAPRRRSSSSRTIARHRGAPAHDHALRQELDQGDREGDHGVRRRPDAPQRRQRDPPRRSPS